MDSFYDAPRSLPQTIARDKLAAVPVVPEISILCSSNQQSKNAIPNPYHVWKGPHCKAPLIANGNKENYNFIANQPTQNSSILKKQVRFEGPVLMTNKPQVLNYKPILDQIENSKTNVLASHSHNADSIPVQPTFQQMYFANPTNIKLDHSILELEKQFLEKNRESREKLQSENAEGTANGESIPKSYKNFVTKNKPQNNAILNDSVTDIFNYKQNPLLTKCFDLPQFTSNNQFNQNQRVAEIKANLFGKKNKPERTANNNLNNENKLRETQKNYQNKDALYGQMSHVLTQPEYEKILTPEISENFHFNSNPQPSTVGFINTANTVNFNDQIVKDNTAIQETKQYCCQCNTKSSETDDVSVKDLLKIISQQSQQIAQQNEQLLLLQKQVSTLIIQEKQSECSTPKKPIEFSQSNFTERKNCYNGLCEREIYDNRQPETYTRYVTNNQHEQNVYNTPRKNKGKISNFSIGVMTSFEVAFSSQPPLPHSKKLYHCLPNAESTHPCEPLKIQEIEENSSGNSTDNQHFIETNNSQNSKTLGDLSMVFKEPIQFREPTPSPEPTIKFNTNEFEDFESDDDDDLEPETELYKNVMNQVNQMLQNAQIPTRKDHIQTCDANYTRKLNNKSMRKVKAATLKHLKTIGIDVPNMDDTLSKSNSSDETTNESYTQDDISFTVKQLLMKYLPDDYLAKVSGQKGPIYDLSSPSPELLTPKDKRGAIKNRPEFSFASVQYMKKYNLIANAPKDFNKPVQPAKIEKILDISKLKQQPKLL